MSSSGTSLVAFLKVFVKNAGSVASGALSVLATGIALYLNPRFDKALFFGVAAVSGVGAAYIVWKAERVAREKLEAYLGKADLQIELLKAWRWTGRGTFLLIQMAVTNTSVTRAGVRHFSCRVRGEAGWATSEGWTNVDEVSEFMVLLRDSNTWQRMDTRTTDLAVRLQETVLERGERALGYVEFAFALPAELRNFDGTIETEMIITDTLGETHRKSNHVPYSTRSWMG